MTKNSSTHTRRHGLSSLYLPMIMIPLVAFMAISFDFGRVRYGRGQLQTATDSAARAGAYGVPYNLAVANAVTYAAKNQCLRTPVQISGAQDVQVGTWDFAKRTFTPIQSTGGRNDPILAANAVKANAARTAARGDPVNYVVLPVIGIKSGDIATTGTAVIRGSKRAGYGVVGLRSISFGGNGLTDSYNGAAGPYPGAGAAGQNGNIASNGNIDFNGGPTINGDARPGLNGTLTLGSATVTGWRAPLDFTITEPTPTLPTAPTAANNNNASIPSGMLDKNGNLTNTGTLPGGTPTNPMRYYFPSINISGGGGGKNGPGNVVFAGPATVVVGSGGITMNGGVGIVVQDAGIGIVPNEPVQIYAQGNVKITGGVTVQSGNASNFYLTDVTPGSTVQLDANTQIYGHIYVPLSDLSFGGGPQVYGWAIGNTVTIKGSGSVHYDLSSPLNTNLLSIVLVQ